ncbi:MAG TPA: SAM-dependent chlorinase/fluorinase [Ktedonobacterales bacterium]|nr:SAM-dependent chlorinase/fluorinase [Ktedonobacterales bacterium]
MKSIPLVALLTDFGTRDGYVGVMKGVMLGIAPDVRLVDLTHEIPPQDVWAGAWVLHTSWRAFPQGTVFLCVVDPGVGTGRRPVALRAGGQLFVGPDNGLFSYVLAEAPAERAVMLDKPLYHLPAPSTTFHGRDIFAPCAAHLARSILLDAVGTLVTVESLVRLPLPQPEWRDDALVGHVLYVDIYGNLITDFGPARTDAILTMPDMSLRIAGETITERCRTFGEGPQARAFALRDSSGHLAIAMRDGSAAALLGAGVGDDVTIVGMAHDVGVGIDAGNSPA